MRERIEAMKAIWTEDEASYSGRHVGFERERIERLGQAGVHRVVFWLPPESADAVEQGFDHYVAAMDQFQTAG